MKGNRKFTPEETANFCSQIAMLLGGGIPLYEGTHILCEEMDDGETKEVLSGIDENVKTGMAFYKALGASKAFPNYVVNMAEVGERTGKLEEVMKSLSAYYERETDINEGVRNVIFYPVVLFIMMAVILGVLVTRILPMFENVFLELDNKTGATETMMSVSLVLGRTLSVIMLAAVLVIVGGLLVYRLKNGAGTLDSLVNFLPFTKKLSGKLGMGKFLAALSLMVTNGMDSTEATEMAVQVLDDEKSLGKAEACSSLLKEGKPFDAALTESGVVTAMQGRMVNVGIKSGTVDHVLEHLSERADEEIGEKLGGLTATIETVLVIAMSIIVGAILISVMMPLISVIASI